MAHKNTIQYCTKLLTTKKYCQTALVIRYVILLQTKMEKKYEVSQTSDPTLNCHITDNIRLLNGETKKNHGLDYFTENQFAEGIQLT
jgi:hypothetical protein